MDIQDGRNDRHDKKQGRDGNAMNTEEHIRKMTRIVLEQRPEYPSSDLELQSLVDCIWEDVRSRPDSDCTMDYVARIVSEEIFSGENNKHTR